MSAERPVGPRPPPLKAAVRRLLGHELGIRWLWVSVAAFAAGTLSSWLTYRSSHIQSDDASQLTIFDSVRHRGLGRITLSEDHFLTRAPLTVVATAFGGGVGRAAVYIATALVGMGCALALIGAAAVLGRRYRPSPTATTVVSAISVVVFAPMTLSFIRPVTRGFEVILAIAIGGWVVGRTSPAAGIVNKAIPALLLAAVASADPYVRWLVIFPLLGLLVVRFALAGDRRNLAGPALTLSLACLGSFALDLALRPLHIHLVRFPVKPRFNASLSEWTDAASTLVRLAAPYGFEGVRGPASLARLAFLGWAGIVWAMALATSIRRRSQIVIEWYVVILPILVIGAYVVSGYVHQPETGRYLVPAFFAFPLCAELVHSRGATASRVGGDKAFSRLTHLAGAFALLGGVGYGVTHRVQERYTAEERAWEQISAVLRDHGPAYGYASYWEANRSIVLTSGVAVTIPTACDRSTGRFSTYSWLVNSALSHNVGPAFILLDKEFVDCRSSLPESQIVWEDEQLGWQLVVVSERPEWGLLP